MAVNNTKEFLEYVKANPKSNFVVFTHVNETRFWHPDFLIRKFLARVPRYKKRGVTLDTTFSHCGTVWWEDNVPAYYHQTYPTFTKGTFYGRPYFVAYEVKDRDKVELARTLCKELYDKKKPYALSTLVTFAFTLWFTWISNPIKAGKVCSQAVAYTYPGIVKGESRDADPQHAEFAFRDKLPSLKRFEIRQ